MQDKRNEQKCKCNKGVNCAVHTCCYHDGKCGCTAKTVSIGPSNAIECRETVCATFKKREDDTIC